MSDRSSPGTMAAYQQVNLMVALRVRPLASEEKAKGMTQIAYRVDNKMVVLLDPGDNLDDVLRQKRSREKRFLFDVAFGPESTQEEVYEKTTKDLIENVVTGYNATVFAYGATGAGKTFTMLGTENNFGLMARALDDLFRKIESVSNEFSFKVKMSYLEIYNEMIRDLLLPSSGYLDVREDSKGGIQVVGLTEIGTNSSKDILRLLMEGNKRRTQEPTAANKTSSRSHAILQVSITHKPRSHGVKATQHTGKLFLIDLAGSERAAQTQNTGRRLKEGAHINRSLLALGNVINTLERGASYVNYRDSKLTRLLKDSLGGNSHTVMIANISPASSHFEESRNTLIYADRAKNITMKLSRNSRDVTFHVEQYQSIISELRKEIIRLKGKIDEQNGLPVSSSLIRSESALSFLKDKQALVVDKNANHLPPINDKPLIANEQKSVDISPEFYQLKDEISSLFRRQMQLRQTLMTLNEEAYDLKLSLSDKINELKAMELTDVIKSDDRQATKLKRDIENLEKALDDLEHKRSETEWDLTVNQKKAKQLEEIMSQKVTANEEKEMLATVLRLHEAEIEKIALQSDALLLQRRLQRQQSSLHRLRNYNQTVNQVIVGQHDLIQSSNLQYPTKLQSIFNNYQTQQRTAEYLLGPSSLEAEAVIDKSWNRRLIDSENWTQSGALLNKTMNASELRHLQRMASMLERSDNNQIRYMRRTGSADDLVAQLPAIESGVRINVTDHSSKRRSNASLIDIKNLAKERRTAHNGVTWKTPVAEAIAISPSDFETLSESSVNVADAAYNNGDPSQFRPVKVVKSRSKPETTAVGESRSARANGHKRSLSKQKRKNRTNSSLTRSSVSGQTPRNGSTTVAPKINPNRRVRSPTQPRLPVIR